jgi:hypothetical protein
LMLKNVFVRILKTLQENIVIEWVYIISMFNIITIDI